MKNICFDLCAIPLYMLILWSMYVRKMTRGRANRLFIIINAASLVCAVMDVLMEYTVNPLPLSPGAVQLTFALSSLIKYIRNTSIVLYFVLIFYVTRTEYRLKPLWVRLLLWGPNAVLMLMLVQNLFTHNVFTVTVAGGYARGPMLAALYAVAFTYTLAGAAYCIFCKRYLVASKWAALISIYVLTMAGVVVQMVRPDLLVEMFSTSLCTLMVLLLIIRPEDTVGGEINVQGWKAYKPALKRVLQSGRHVQVVAIQIMNADEIRRYLGDGQFHTYVMEVAGEIDRLYYDLQVHIDLFFERPGTFYLILESARLDVSALVPKFTADVEQRVEPFAEQGVRFEPRYCIIRCPEDTRSCQDIIDIGHTFTFLDPTDRQVTLAADLLNQRDFTVYNHMKEILNRMITEGTLEMYYQPIYNLREGRFESAEALARVTDPEFGMISPGVFIPAAEDAGLIVPLGNIILESVYRFISQIDMDRVGLRYVEINLSVAQCMQLDLPATVLHLQEKYGVKPERVNFEITETMFDNLSAVMNRNLEALSQMGYSFSLDDYGIGYSNIQRLSKLPLDIIKIDKSLADDMFNEQGQVIIRNTVRMMQEIHKSLVIEGVETREQVEALTAMSCDYIQGYYYARPMPAEAFVDFMTTHNV